MKTPLNRNTFKQHITYNWWKYLLAAVVIFFAVDLLYTVTAYRVPADKKVEFYVYGYLNEDKMSAYMEKVRSEQMSDMEEMSSLMMIADETYGVMQLTTYVAAGEGDLYLLPKDQFISLSSGGALVPLEDDEALISLFGDAGVSLQSGWRRESETGESHLFGIPQNKLPSLSEYCQAEDGYLCVLAMNGNTENTLKFLRILCEDMLREPEPATLPEEQTGAADASAAP